MMTGNVFNRHALVSVTFRLSNQPDLAIEFVVDTGFSDSLSLHRREGRQRVPQQPLVVDTGFSDSLSLPPAAVAALGLPYEYDLPANLANNDAIMLPVHAATILWNGVERNIRVLAMPGRPPLGTALLDDHELVIPFREGGLVTVDDL
ncbi:MAG TPA: hypothetical protein VFB21_08500 [Chthonomonadaceae bacterium]|nr:hypothetical protein [Chthonomonadaceae bacterium]